VSDPGLTPGLEGDRREVELGCAFERDKSDRQVLDGQARRVEGGDVVHRATPFRGPGQHISELRHVLADEKSRFDGGGALRRRAYERARKRLTV
jgi:hypothetical protein